MGSDFPPIDKAQHEKTWASHAVRKYLDAEDKALWNSCQYTVRPFVYYDKILIAWTVLKGEPQVKEVFSMTGLEASFQDGLSLTMDAKVTKGYSPTINHVPRRLQGLDIFAWVPYFNEMRYVSAQWEDPTLPKNMRLAACFKMRSRPERLLKEGEHYLSELHVFRDKFPQYASTRF